MAVLIDYIQTNYPWLSAHLIFISIVQSLFFAIIFKCIWEKRRMYLLSLQMPGPFSLPILGSVLATGITWPSSETVKSIFREYVKYESPFRIWYFNNFVVVISDPDDIDSLVVDNNIPTKTKLHYFWSQAIGNGLWTGQGGLRWRKHKSILTSIFCEKVTEKYDAIIERHCNELCNSILQKHKNHKFELKKLLETFSGQIMSSILLGDDNMKIDVCERLTVAIRNLEKSLNERLSKIWLRPNFVFEKSECFEMMKCDRHCLQQYISEAFEKKKNYYFSQKRAGKVNVEDSAIYAMITAQNGGHGLYDNEIVEEIMSTYVVGFDSVCETLAFFILMMAMHKECQGKLLEEIAQFERRHGNIQLGNIMKIKYLDMCYMEVLRLFPREGLLLRYADEDLILKTRNITIPKGSYVALPTYFMNLNEKYWDDPEKFCPERFSETGGRPVELYQNIPFGISQRNCIGEQLANYIIKSAMVNILKQFVFSAPNKMDDLELTYENHVRLKKEIDVQVSDRMF